MKESRAKGNQTKANQMKENQTRENRGKENLMRTIKVVKVTLNFGAGKDEELLKKGLKLLQKISPQKPVKTSTHKRIPAWGLRPGLAVGSKVTLREGAEEMLKRLLAAKENNLSEGCFDNQGNFSFGIPEYIDIPGLDYDPELKILGLEVAVTLERAGGRLKHRKIKPGRIGKNNQITKEQAVEFVRRLGVNVG